MVDNQEDQKILAYEGSIAIVEHCDDFEDQSQRATTTLTNMNKKVPVVVHELEEEMEKPEANGA